MFLSKLSEDFSKEFQRITRPVHIEKIWAEMDKRIDSYWDGLLAAETPSDPGLLLAANPMFKVTVRKPSPAERAAAESAGLRERFVSTIAAYEKEAAHYRDFLDRDALAEYGDQPDQFKPDFRKELPIIRYCLNSRAEVMKKWKEQFSLVASQDYLDLMENLLDWADSFKDEWPEDQFAVANEFQPLHACGLDEETFESSDDFVVAGVIGYGIRACILHHLDAQFFPHFGRNGSLAMFFLSGGNGLGRLNDSEFLILDDVYDTDKSKKMDHNYWYPFSLFTLYCLRLYRQIEARSAKLGIELNPKYRFVYVSSFFDEVRRVHEDAIKTMLATDDIERNGLRRR